MILHSNKMMQMSSWQESTPFGPRQSLRSSSSSNNKPSIVNSKLSRGFTLIEIVTALVILALIVSGSLVIINNCQESALDMKMKMAAFSLARENMEKLLGASAVTEAVDYGDSNDMEGISWETRIEPFYDPHTNRMWIRGVSSASWYDAMAQFKTIEFTQWITDLTVADIQKILRRQADQEGALDEQSQAIVDELLKQLLEARDSAGANGYGEMVEWARNIIDGYPTSAAANIAKHALNDMPAPAKQEFNIQPHETQTTPISDSSGNPGDSSSSGDSPTNTLIDDPIVFGKYKLSEWEHIMETNEQEGWRIVSDYLKTK